MEDFLKDDINNLYLNINENRIGIFAYKVIIEKGMMVRRKLLNREIKEYDNNVRSMFLKKYMHMDKLLKSIFTLLKELEINDGLINKYYALKDELKMLGRNDSELNFSTLVRCLNKIKIFDMELQAIGRYVDVECEENLKFLSTKLSLRFIKMKDFVSSKKELLKCYIEYMTNHCLGMFSTKTNEFIEMLAKFSRLEEHINCELLIFKCTPLYVEEINDIYEELKEIKFCIKNLMEETKGKIRRESFVYLRNNIIKENVINGPNSLKNIGCLPENGISIFRIMKNVKFQFLCIICFSCILVCFLIFTINFNECNFSMAHSYVTKKNRVLTRAF
uniref:Pv-fam-d protein n=1 Tax=Parastrongyloides trichosuri TaxID=131310 RepID=A0A0N4ZVJ5_PARTI